MTNPNFEVSTITVAGAEMLAKATEGNRVIFTGCEATSAVYTLALAKLIYNISGSRITDLIEVTDVTDARILVRAKFEPSATTGGEANSLILFGRLSSHKEDARTPICVVSNSAPFYLPTSDQEAVTAFDCLFTVQYNISSPVVVEQTSALECSLAEFRQLKERVVTTHKAGQETEGENQSIFGTKTFENNVIIGDGLDIYGESITDTLYPRERSATLGLEDYEWGNFYSQNANISGNLYVGNGILPDENAGGNVGSSLHKWGYVYANHLFASDASFDGGARFGASVSISGGVNPGGASLYSLGESYYKWLNLYADSLSGSALALANVLCPSNDTPLSISIGGIFIGVILVTKSAGSGATSITRGDSISSASKIIRAMSLYSETNTGGAVKINVSSSSIQSGTYRLLNTAYFEGNSSSSLKAVAGIALMVRIA